MALTSILIPLLESAVHLATTIKCAVALAEGEDTGN